jgi:hypothetical protein
MTGEMERTITKRNEETDEERSSESFRIGSSEEFDNSTRRWLCGSNNSEQGDTIFWLDQKRE